MCFRLESIEGNEGQRIRRVSTTDESSEEEEELTEEEQGLCIVCLFLLTLYFPFNYCSVMSGCFNGYLG